MGKTIREGWKRLVAYLLAAVMVLVLSAPAPVSAAGGYAMTSVTTLAANSYYPDWYTAVCIDKLPWNKFHNEVQNDIRAKNKNVTTEKGISGGGRADVVVELNNEATYIWEVKPASYGLNPVKERLALKQLDRYVSADKKHKYGNGTIQNGEAQFSTVTNRGAYTEYVTYKIEYQNAQNGLILYHFTRYVDKTEVNEEVVEEAAAVVTYPAYDDAVEKVVTVITDVTPKDGIPDVQEVDKATLIKLYKIALVWGRCHEKIEANPNTSNSLSAAISESCAVYVSIASPIIVFAAEKKGDTKYLARVNAAMDDFLTALEVYGGEELAEELYFALHEPDTERLDELIKKIQNNAEDYERAGEAQPPRDPLIIDLGETGIRLHALENGVNFDLDNNGFAEKTAWIDAEDGFLALDRNGNGAIDNGGELFGDQVTLKDGTKSSSGFEALAEADDNQDKVIDSRDAIYDLLRVWTDVNHNGISEQGELKTLPELGILSISLAHEEKSIVDAETGARIAETALVSISRDGTTADVEISEFWFPVNASDTMHGSTVTTGNMLSIAQALADDGTGELFTLCCQFSETEDIAEKRYYTKKILYFMAGASDIPENSRGGNIDARDLKVIEQCMGREFQGVGGANPNVNAAAILQDIYGDIENQYYNLLNMYAGLGGYLKCVYEYEDGDEEENGNSGGKKGMDLTLLNQIIDTKISDGENVDALVYDLGIYLKSYDEINDTNYYGEYGERYKAVSDHYADIVEMTKSGVTYIGTDDGDTYGGTSGRDYIFGEDGDDILSGGNGNDTIIGNGGNDILNGGAGNDILSGGEGNDTYIFAAGYGSDSIIDSEGSNTLRFTGIRAEDIWVNGIRDDDAEAADIIAACIKIKSTEDVLLIKDFGVDGEFADYTLEFQDKTVHCNAEGSPFKHICGSDSDDVLTAVADDSVMHAFGGNDTVTGSKGSDIIYGNEGNDTVYAGMGDDSVYGGAGNDIMLGEAGNDIMFGGDGQDTLDGGGGNDYLFGGADDDTYIFGRGYGTDIVEDTEGVSTIMLKDDLSMEDIYVFEAGDEAVIGIRGTEDRLVISGYGNNREAYRLSAGDGDINVGDIISDTIPEGMTGTGTDASEAAEGQAVTFITGTDGEDAIFADSKKSIIASGGGYDYIVGGAEADLIFGDGDTDRISAGAGDDVIFGGAGGNQLFGEDGEDVIIGGADNDYISCGEGDDIVIAGKGADFIEGASGDDTYYFNSGDGVDTITDSEGMNFVIFGDGICADGIKAYRSNWNDLLVTFEGADGPAGEALIIRNYCVDENARCFRFVFADGTMFYAADADSPLRQINDNIGTEYIPSIYEDGIVIVSTDGDDGLTGSGGDDILVGGDGNNRIIGNAGNDILDGGKGSDYLSGGAGDDIYIYQKGYGTDTICDSEGTGYIEIEGYSASEVRAYRFNWNDIALVMDGSGEAGLSDAAADKIIIEGFYSSESNRNFYLSFDGVRVHAAGSTSPLRTIYATAESSFVQGFDDRGFTIYGSECSAATNGGNSATLNGSSAADFLYGGSGDDRLLGFAGNDELNGGSGNDWLEGGEGNDTYIFGMGSGTDSISDNQGINVICFGEGLNREDLIAYRTDGNNLTISFEGSEDSLVIWGYFVSEAYRRFEVVFADGSRFAYDSAENPLNMYGGATAEE